MHTVCFKLKTTAYERKELARRFFALSHIHNVLVKHVRKLLIRLEHDVEYQEVLKEYRALLKKKTTPKEELVPYKERLNEIRNTYGLTEAGLQSYIKVCGKRYQKMLSSSQVQKEATRVWAGVSKVLFKDGKQVHFKKYRDFDTIGGKSPTNGVIFEKETLSIEWLGLSLNCIIPRQQKTWKYLVEALDAQISYCELERKMFPNGWHYYVKIVLRGDAPKKFIPGDSVMGIDPGTSTISAVSDTDVFLEELAKDAAKYEKKIFPLQQSMDRSKRMMNPQNYHEDGTIKKGKKTWKYSRMYFKKRDLVKTLYRKKSSVIKQSHEILCNKLLQDSRTFLVEDMDFKALQKRAKETKRQEKQSAVRQKDGSVKMVYKYKRKKRFGHSIGSRAPSLFLTILKQKTKLYGGTWIKIKTKEFRASQYDHIKDEYIKVPLSQRWKEIGNYLIQRDLYSAFLIRYAASDRKHANRKKCLLSFENFRKMHDRLIEEMKRSGRSMKQCFGF